MQIKHKVKEKHKEGGRETNEIGIENKLCQRLTKRFICNTYVWQSEYRIKNAYEKIARRRKMFKSRLLFLRTKGFQIPGHNK